MIRKIFNRFKKNNINQDDEITLIKNQLNDINFKIDLLLKDSNFPKYDSLRLNNTNKTKLLLIGYYGGGSLGDNFMLDEILFKIDKDKFDITIMIAPTAKSDVTKYSKYNIIYTPVKVHEIHEISKNFDVVIAGGGAIIDDLYYLVENYHMTFATTIINLLYAFTLQNKKTIVYGCSTNNKLKNKDYIKKLKYVVENAYFFSLRDSYSLESLKALDINVGSVKVVDDLAFSSDILLMKKRRHLAERK